MYLGVKLGNSEPLSRRASCAGTRQRCQARGQGHARGCSPFGVSCLGEAEGSLRSQLETEVQRRMRARCVGDSLMEKQGQQGNVCVFFLKSLSYGSRGQSPNGVSRGKDHSVGRAGSRGRLADNPSAFASQPLEAPRFAAPRCVLKPAMWALPAPPSLWSVVRFPLHLSFSFLDIYFLNTGKRGAS